MSVLKSIRRFARPIRKNFVFAKDYIYKKMICPQIMNIDETLDYIIKYKCSVARFGDGEFSIMIGGDLNDFQNASVELIARLRHIVAPTLKEQADCLICIPGFWAIESLYTEGVKQFWQRQLPWNGTRRKYTKMLNNKYYYGNADITRCYLGMADKDLIPGYFQKWKRIWDNRHVLLLEGEATRFAVCNDLLDNTLSVQRILCPKKNAFASFEIIKESVEKVVMGVP